jgi:hypothetical protein
VAIPCDLASAYRRNTGPVLAENLVHRARTSVQGRGREAICQLALIGALFVAYRLGRILANGHVPRALSNARDVWSFERAVHLPRETTVQAWFVQSDTITQFANTYYASAHFSPTATGGHGT